MGDIGGRPSLTLALQFLTEKSTTVYKFVKKAICTDVKKSDSLNYKNDAHFWPFKFLH